MTIADMRQPDQPLVYVNAAFEALAGFPRADVLGRNCRFLQSPDADPAAVARILERFGESTGGSPKGVAVRLEHGAHELAEVVRALDSAGVEVEHLQLHAPSLNDVFLAKTGRSLEGAAEEAEQEE